VAQRSLGQAAAAKASFSHALRLRPGMTDAALALANLAGRGGANDEAARLAGEVLRANPNSAEAYVANARAVLAKGDARHGEDLLQDALKRNPASLPALAMLVKLYAREGRTKEVLGRISSVLSEQPRNPGLHFLLAVCYFDLKDLANSETSVKDAIRLDPKTRDAFTLLADIDYARGLADKAKSDLRTAIELNPRNVSNYLALGAWYARDGNWDEARKLWEQAHEVDPASPVAAGQLAFLYLEHGGDLNVALSLAQTAKRAIPDSAPAADTLGWAYYKLGSPGLAVAQLQQSVQKDPTNPVYLYHLGMAYGIEGNSQSAQRFLQEALQRTPNFIYAADARDALKKISSQRR
ncbi:MAG: tetratricopeptide repeat protein, partial [Bryobacteraceae bacterium]